MKKNLSFLTLGLLALTPIIKVLLFPLQVKAGETNQYLDMSLSDLLDVEVNSVSHKQELLRHAGAAIFVITAEDIRRSGVSSIPDALRMVPGVNIGRIKSNGWAITSRGFNGCFANKLLVLIRFGAHFYYTGTRTSRCQALRYAD